MTKPKRFIRVRSYNEVTNMYEVWCSDAMSVETPEEGVNGYIGECDAVLLATIIGEDYLDASELVGPQYYEVV